MRSSTMLRPAPRSLHRPVASGFVACAVFLGRLVLTLKTFGGACRRLGGRHDGGARAVGAEPHEDVVGVS
jgi:hypothetical protein